MKKTLLLIGTFVTCSIFSLNAQDNRWYLPSKKSGYFNKSDKSNGTKMLQGEITSSSVYIPGVTFDMEFELFHNSPDGEFVQKIELDFPSGITVNSAQSFDLPWNGETGDGAITSWGSYEYSTGVDANWSVNVSVSESFNSDFVIGWKQYGDYDGNEPHIISGSINIPPAILNDLGIINITPSYMLSGSTSNPEVWVRNSGSENQNIYNISLTDGNQYNQQLTVTEPIGAFEIKKIEFPAWSPSNGIYELTATVELTNDGNNINDSFSKNIEVRDFNDGEICLTAVNYGDINGTAMTGVIDRGSAFWYYVNLEETGHNIKFSLCGSDFDTKMEIINDCEDTNPLFYNDDSFNCNLTESEIIVNELPAGNYYVKIYGFDEFSNGNFIFTVSIPNNNDMAVVNVTKSGFLNRSYYPEVILKNIGNNPQNSYNVKVYIMDGQNELYFSEKNPDIMLLHGEDLLVEMNDPFHASALDGNYTISAQVEMINADDNPSDNILSQSLSILDIDPVKAAYITYSNSGFYYLGAPYFESSYPESVHKIGIFGGTYAGDNFYAIHGYDYFKGLVVFNSSMDRWTGVGLINISDYEYAYNLAYDRAGDKLYTIATNGEPPAMSTALFEIDRSTGRATLVTTIAEPTALMAIAADNNGNLYAVKHQENGNGQFCSIDINTGQLNVIGNMGDYVESLPQAMTFDPNDNSCYLIAYADYEGLNGTYRINTATGEATKIGENPGSVWEDVHISGIGIKSRPLVNINPVETNRQVSVYPNPSNGDVNIMTNENSTVRVTDISGKTITTFNVDAGSSFSFNQPSGMYFIQVESGGITSVHKLLIVD